MKYYVWMKNGSDHYMDIFSPVKSESTEGTADNWYLSPGMWLGCLPAPAVAIHPNHLVRPSVLCEIISYLTAMFYTLLRNLLLPKHYLRPFSPLL